MDSAMEQSIALQGCCLQWELPENTNKLCHRSNNAGQNNSNINSAYSPNSINPTNPKQSAQRLRSNKRKGKDRSVLFSTSRHNNTSAPNSSGHNPPLVDPN
ncbi:hypothetical protein RhiirC2_801056 [Rhizophagus irregularis]|uniref:Uncharacterized protein n=1 Tax=Rhizophagus irregularis TaxID=588596 RepID=A0A2N1M2T8_9GLOM|nr:hypothetical protein RhiirC2_801056 [Rhizophagus irregularis]